jgi:hypothetical protein
METRNPDITASADAQRRTQPPAEPERYLAGRDQLAAFLREHGFPASKDLLDKAAHRGTGPEPAGTWFKWLMYRPSDSLAWARAHFRPRGSAGFDAAAERRQRPNAGRPPKRVQRTQNRTRD